jgi:phage terminase small subunit
MTDNLTPKQRKAIEALLTTGSDSQAAQAANVSRDTIYRWLKQAEFKTALEEATAEAINNLSRSLVGLGDQAIETLRDTMEDESISPGARVSAARVVLDNILKIRELASIEQRLTELEKVQNENKQ